MIQFNVIALRCLSVVNVSGQGSAPNAQAVGAFAKIIAEIGWDIASKSKINHVSSSPASGTRQYSTMASGHGSTPGNGITEDRNI